MFLQIYIPVVFDDSDTRCYKLRGLTDHSTDATGTVPLRAIQSQTVVTAY